MVEKMWEAVSEAYAVNEVVEEGGGVSRRMAQPISLRVGTEDGWHIYIASLSGGDPLWSRVRGMHLFVVFSLVLAQRHLAVCKRTAC